MGRVVVLINKQVEAKQETVVAENNNGCGEHPGTEGTRAGPDV